MYALLFLALCGATFAQKVNVQFFGESLCPYCREFMGGTLNQTLEDPQMLAIMDFQYYPWGNAYFNIDGCGGTPGSYDPTVRLCWGRKCSSASPPSDCFTAPITWQHGDNEGYGNRVEACVKQATPDVLQQLRFDKCFEVDGSASKDDFRRCAAQTGIHYDIVSHCVNNDVRASAALAAEANATLRFAPAHAGVPWVIVGTDAATAPSDLTQSVCMHFTGSNRPKACDNALRAVKMSL
eukprot:TRINITY_DN45253_c0_g1_i1.p1 TRINITY_DN45253_c0_g1~~TRINITY_DN45253_c0_g1_i1.p1  ORF type:complete len:259 (-),score=36.86 TRINITY_DN45253_c0_g1_i1:211-924(-)